MRIGEALQAHFGVRNNAIRGNGTAVKIDTFLNSFKKGSKQVRNIIASTRSKNHSPENMANLRNFCVLIECDRPEGRNINRWLSWWATPRYSNKLKEFLLKFTNNLLGVNARLAHFVANQDPHCTFCTALDVQNNRYRETFSHLFYTCEKTSGLRTWVINKYFRSLNLDSSEKLKGFWFFAIDPRSGDNNNWFITAAVATLLLILWECKLSKEFPAPLTVEQCWLSELARICKNNQKMATFIATSNCDLGLQWQQQLAHIGQ